VVVFDWMLTGAGISGERAGLPTAALIHCPYPLPVDGAPPVFTGLAPMNGWLGTKRDHVLGHGAMRLLNRSLPVLNKARAEQGLGPLSDWGAQLRGAQEIYMMSAPELDFSSRGALPANLYYVGPAFEPFSDEWISPWPETNTDPLVLISFSTSYMNQLALAQRVLNAVGSLPVRGLLTAGPALDVTQLHIPANTRSVAFIPHRAVLPYAALMVTHAGWQTVNAALADGVPLICIPDGRDQPDNAARVAFTGAGVRVSKKISTRELTRVIAQALKDPSLKEAANKMASALARSDGALTIAERLEHLSTRDDLVGAV
jgi:UDP:flavonoid glycosyltransferase YjiC (YdhE family)